MNIWGIVVRLFDKLFLIFRLGRLVRICHNFFANSYISTSALIRALWHVFTVSYRAASFEPLLTFLDGLRPDNERHDWTDRKIKEKNRSDIQVDFRQMSTGVEILLM